MISAVLVLWAAQAVSAAEPAGQPSDKFSCSYDIKRRCTSGTAEVELQQGRPRRVNFENFVCGLPGAPGYTCTVESTADGKDKWQQTGKTTRINFHESWNPDNPDTLTVTAEPSRIVLDFADTQSLGKCGSGAELPDRVVIDPKTKRCEVDLK